MNLIDLKIPPHIRCVAVTKNQSLSKIQWAISQGLTTLGENYCQEAISKIEYFKSHFPTTVIEWHYIGQIQSNKTKLIAENFDWVQTISRLDIAKRLNIARAHASLSPLNVCIQINDSQIKTQSGITLKQLPELIKALSAFPHLKLRGLMTMVKNDYEKTAKAFYDLKKEGYDIDTLSMGMSQDYAYAIEKGATMIRLGTVLFGERK